MTAPRRSAIHLLAMAWILCGASMLYAQPLTRRPISDSFFGINGVGYLHYRDAKDATRTAERKMAALKKCGAATDRTDFWWGLIEPEKGRFDWWRTDWMIDYYTRNRIEPLPILSYNAAWMGDISPDSKDDFADYAKYVRAVVGRYCNQVRCWEVWNEPNIETFWKPRGNVEHYSALLKAGYAAAKEVDPTCTIVGAATSMTDINFLMGIQKQGAIRSMDAISFHPYSHSDGPMQMDLARQIRNVRTIMNRFGRPAIPLWITEMGWQADIRLPADVEKQAIYMVQSHVIAAAEGVDRLYWFNLQDWNEGAKLESWGLISAKFEEKKSLTAYRVLREMLLGAEFDRHELLQDATGTPFHAYVFERNGWPTVVAWAERRHQANVPLLHSTVTDIYGVERRVENEQTSITETPVYIQGGLQRFLKNRARPIAENLVTNPSFEDVESTRVYGWDRGMFHGGLDKGEFGIEQGTAADGSRSVSLAATSDAVWNSWPVPALPGEKYTLTLSIKAENATGENYAQILFLAGPGWAWKGGPKTRSIVGTKAWTEVTISGTVPGDADVVRINLASKGNAGKILFDKLRLTRR